MCELNTLCNLMRIDEIYPQAEEKVKREPPVEEHLEWIDDCHQLMPDLGHNLKEAYKKLCIDTIF